MNLSMNVHDLQLVERAVHPAPVAVGRDQDEGDLVPLQLQFLCCLFIYERVL